MIESFSIAVSIANYTNHRSLSVGKQWTTQNGEVIMLVSNLIPNKG